MSDTLIQTAQNKEYTKFEEIAKEKLQAKVAEKLSQKGYFKRLDVAKAELTESKEEYQKFFQKTLKEFGVKSQSELSDDKKKEFYDAIDAGWKGKDEKPEKGE